MWRCVFKKAPFLLAAYGMTSIGFSQSLRLQEFNKSQAQSHYLMHQIEKPSSNHTRIRNRNGQSRIFNLSQEQVNLKIGNFLNPPPTITSLSELKQLLCQLNEDTFLVVLYGTEQTSMTAFNELKYNSTSTRNIYLRISTADCAGHLGIDEFNSVSILRKVNSKYAIKEIIPCMHIKNTQLNHRVNHITHHQINYFRTSEEVKDKIRQIKLSKDDKRILLIYAEETRGNFQQRIDQVLQKVAENLSDQVVIVRIRNEAILKEVFQIDSNQYAVIRIIDVRKPGKGVFGNEGYTRYALQNGFTYINLKKFIMNPQREHQEVKKVTNINSVQKQNALQLKKTLVFHYREGCESCEYMKYILNKMQIILKKIQNNEQIDLKMKDTSKLKQVQLLRINIFNEIEGFPTPTATPKLDFITQNGNRVDLDVATIVKSLAKLTNMNQNQLENKLIYDIFEKVLKIM